MIVYSVTVSIEPAIEADWLNWMKTVHIPDVMNCGVFTANRMLKVLNDRDENSISYNIQYDCPSMKDLHKYQVEHAPKLQKEHTERYEGKFAAFRTLLEKVN